MTKQIHLSEDIAQIMKLYRQMERDDNQKRQENCRKRKEQEENGR